MTVDIFTHIYPRRYLAALPGPARDGRLEAYLESVPAFSDPAARIQVMDRHGIDVQVLTLGYPPALEAVDEATAIRVARVANDAIAETVAAFPGRFIGAATLPLRTPDAARAELERCRLELGLRAIQMFTNVNGRPLDWEGLLPIYAQAAGECIPILLHPIDAHVSYDWIGEYKLDRLFGWPFDTSLALARLVFGGVLRRFPDMKIVAHHGGAMIAYYPDRIFSFAYPDSPALDPVVKHQTAAGVIGGFKQVYIDTVQVWLPALRCATEFFGVDQVLFGSDFPWGPEGGERYIRHSLAAVEALPISAHARERILEGNARRLLVRAGISFQ